VLTATDPRRYPPGVVAVGGPVDWYFHLPLWLQLPFGGHTLWAYNLRHLEFLHDFIAAGLRQHRRAPAGWRNQALANRLPRWMTSTKHRAEVLRGLALLKDRL
jgi:hypothetical protein